MYEGVLSDNSDKTTLYFIGGITMKLKNDWKKRLPLFVVALIMTMGLIFPTLSAFASADGDVLPSPSVSQEPTESVEPSPST